MKKKQIIIIAVLLLGIGIMSGYFYSEYKINQASLIVENTKAYETQVAFLISEQLTVLPTITPQPTATATVNPTQVPVVEYFTSETSLFVYKDPRFDSDVIGNLGVGESAVWAEERKDYSDDPNWHWYHVQFVDVKKSANELSDGYVAVLTEQGKIMAQQSCPAVIVDSMNFYSKFPFIATNPGFVGGAGQGYASIQTGGYTLGKITTTSYGNAEIDSVKAVIIQLDPNTGSPVLVPFNLVIGVQFNDELVYHPRMNIAGFPAEDCLSPETCGLDDISQWYPTYGEKTYTVFQDRDFIVSRFENQMIYGTINGGGFLGTQFNYVDMSYVYNIEYTSSFLSDPADLRRLSEKFYKLFSRYEMETGDRMNLLFLRGEQVPSDWLNMGFSITRFFVIPSFTTEYRYEQSDLLTQCLHAIGSY